MLTEGSNRIGEKENRERARKGWARGSGVRHCQQVGQEKEVSARRWKREQRLCLHIHKQRTVISTKVRFALPTSYFVLVHVMGDVAVLLWRNDYLTIYCD